MPLDSVSYPAPFADMALGPALPAPLPRGNPYYGSWQEDEDRLALARAARPAPVRSALWLAEEAHFNALVRLRAALIQLGRANAYREKALRSEAKRRSMRTLNLVRCALRIAERALASARADAIAEDVRGALVMLFDEVTVVGARA